MLWIVVQVAIIGYVSWMQPVSFVAGAAIAALAGRTAAHRTPDPGRSGLTGDP